VRLLRDLDREDALVRVECRKKGNRLILHPSMEVLRSTSVAGAALPWQVATPCGGATAVGLLVVVRPHTVLVLCHESPRTDLALALAEATALGSNRSV